MSNNNYKDSFKAFSVLGSIQIFVVLINVIRTKIVAVILGATGVGLIGLFQSTIDLISAICNLGFGTSSVRNISSASIESESFQRKVVYCVVRLSQILGLLGAVVCFCFSKYLSDWTFGSNDYTLDFKLLSIVCFLSSLNAGQLALLQGYRKIKSLALANLTGACIAVALSSPLYYYYEYRGIVPSLILMSVFRYLVGLYYVRREGIRSERGRVQECRPIITSIMKVGIMMTISGSILNSIIAYAQKTFIGNIGGMDEVGFYQAFYAIVNSYVGIIFTAMATDYYPRLSKVTKDNEQLIDTVNQQISMSVLILVPILYLLLIFCDTIIPVIYSSEFLVTLPLIRWSLIGVIFKAISFCISFIFVARGNAKIFMICETISNLLMLALNLIGYYFWGLEGLGIFFSLGFIIYTIISFGFAYKKVGFVIYIESARDYLLPVFLFFGGVIVYMFVTDNIIINVSILLLVSLFSIWSLDKRTSVLSAIKNKIKQL